MLRSTQSLAEGHDPVGGAPTDRNNSLVRAVAETGPETQGLSDDHVDYPTPIPAQASWIGASRYGYEMTS
jgi:hypothetical protein